jgi:hypothetical protein
MKKSWYMFNGGTSSNPFDISNYYKLKSSHTCLCGNIICAVYLNDSGLQPNSPFSNNLTNYIRSALSEGEMQPRQPIDAKKYVYLRFLD